MINISHTNPGATGKTAKEGTNPTLSIWTFLLLFSSYSSSFYILRPEKAWAPSLSSLTSQESFLPPSFLLPVGLGLFSHVEYITCPVATQDRSTPETEWKIKTEKVITANACITESVMRIKLHDHTPASEGYEDLWKADLTLWPFPPWQSALQICSNFYTTKDLHSIMAVTVCKQMTTLGSVSSQAI